MTSESYLWSLFNELSTQLLCGFSHEGTRRDLASIITDASSLPPTDKENIKTALMNKISTLQDTDVAARGFASGAASTAVGGAASIAANSVVSTLLNKVESLFRRDEYVSTELLW